MEQLNIIVSDLVETLDMPTADRVVVDVRIDYCSLRFTY